MEKVLEVNAVCEGANAKSRLSSYRTLLMGLIILSKNLTDPLLLQQQKDMLVLAHIWAPIGQQYIQSFVPMGYATFNQAEIVMRPHRSAFYPSTPLGDMKTCTQAINYEIWFDKI